MSITNKTARLLTRVHVEEIGKMTSRIFAGFGASYGREEIRDCAADCVLAMLAGKAESFDPIHGVKFSTWVMACARNFAIDRLRHLSLREEGGFSTVDAEEADKINSQTVNADTSCEERQALKLVADQMGEGWYDLLGIVDDDKAWAERNRKTIGNAHVIKSRLLAKAREIAQSL